ncbi:MAG: hypothetical protein BWY21_01000 [Parcubacteria group bacterium ADurb.Bin216]|nr:MAG: hypothetical protein BWY21_01000 [Parcubacteria group bacterium ADurb.Bin216]
MTIWQPYPGKCIVLEHITFFRLQEEDNIIVLAVGLSSREIITLEENADNLFNQLTIALDATAGK